MADQIPVVDLAAALGDRAPDGQLDSVRNAAEQVGVIQVVNHGVPGDLLADYGRPEQLAAWREGRPYVAGLSETSAGQ